jgi:hypothetical protein
MGLILGGMLMTALQVSAQSRDVAVGDTIAKFVPVVVNGKALSVSGALLNSERVVVPARALGEALGYEVEWIDGTVILKNPSTETPQLDDMTCNVKSSHFDTNSAGHKCFYVGGEWYIPVTALPHYVERSSDTESTVSIPNVGSVKCDRTAQYQAGCDAFADRGIVYVQVGALNLTAALDGNILTLKPK